MGLFNFSHKKEGENYYDRLFSNLLATNTFCIAEISCFVKYDEIECSNEKDKNESLLSGYIFLWIRYIYYKSNNLYNNIINLSDKPKNISFEEQKSFINHIFPTNNNLDDIYNNTVALYEIYQRCCVYNYLIINATKITIDIAAKYKGGFLKKYIDGVNEKFGKTTEIKHCDFISLEDVVSLFIRDFTGGKNIFDIEYIAEEQTIKEQEAGKSHFIKEIHTKKIQQCIDIANEYMRKKGYTEYDYSIDGCYDFLSFWNNKGLFSVKIDPRDIHNAYGFYENTILECILNWYRILKNDNYAEKECERITKVQQEMHARLYGLVMNPISSVLLKQINFPLSEISVEQEFEQLKLRRQSQVQIKKETINQKGYSLVNKTISANSDLGKYLTVAENMILPFYILDYEKIDNQLHRKQLLCGILLGYDESNAFSQKYFPLILQYLKQSFQYGSREKMIVDAVTRIRKKTGNYEAYLALSNGNKLLPNRAKLQFDCAMSLYNLMLENEYPEAEKGKSVLRELVNEIDTQKINQNLVTYIGAIKNFVKIDEDIIYSKTNQLSLFIDENGDPQILKQNCSTDRIGKEMTREERHKFAVDLLADLYTKAGMKMLNVNHHYDREFPNLVMESKNGKRYYVIIETACYPKKAESLYSRDFKDVKDYAKAHKAILTFAGMSFLNIDMKVDNSKMICGNSYTVAFKGLEAI
jgi:hypothetical protein